MINRTFTAYELKDLCLKVMRAYEEERTSRPTTPVDMIENTVILNVVDDGGIKNCPYCNPND